jgi:hypothetical protein
MWSSIRRENRLPRKPASFFDDLVDRFTSGLNEYAEDFAEEATAKIDDLVDRFTSGLKEYAEDFAEEAAAEIAEKASHAAGSQVNAQNRRRGERAQGRSATRQRDAAPTHYDILGVNPKAPQEVIQAAYKALSRIHHPDAGGSTLEMKRINQAYTALKDPKKRAIYDRSIGR